jgi:uncharacterized protein YkwD
MPWWLNWLRWPFRESHPEPPEDPLPDVSREVLRLMNVLRAERALPPLELDPKLSSLAQTWANVMAGDGIIRHGDFVKRLSTHFPNRRMAENVAVGQTSALWVVTDWMGSARHRENILGDYELLGVGHSRTDRGSNSLDVWCVDFVGGL